MNTHNTELFARFVLYHYKGENYALSIPGLVETFQALEGRTMQSVNYRVTKTEISLSLDNGLGELKEYRIMPAKGD